MKTTNLVKLAEKLSGKERAKLIITDWHKSIATGKGFLNKEESAAIGNIKISSVWNEFMYFAILYKNALFLRAEIEKLELRLSSFCIAIINFHLAFSVDWVIESGIREIKKVPKFLSEKNFKQRWTNELEKEREPIVYLANHETNAILKEKGFFKDKDELDYYLDLWQPETKMEEIEKEYGDEWSKTYWEQIERIRSLIKSGTLVSVSINEDEEKTPAVKITGIREVITAKSWLNFKDKHDKNYRPYSETEELYAISYDSGEVAYGDLDKEPFGLIMRKRALDLLKQFTVMSEDYDWKNHIKTLTIKEESLLLHSPKEKIKWAQEIIKKLFEYEEAVKEIEKELDGLPLFDEGGYSQFKDCLKRAEEFINHHNEFIEGLGKKEDEYWKIVLKDKEDYLLKIPKPDQIVVNQIVQDLKSLVATECRAWDVDYSNMWNFLV